MDQQIALPFVGSREYHQAARRRWKARNQERVIRERAITNRLHGAIRKGLVTKGPCQDCGVTPAQAHHHNGYDEAHILDVVWLCPTHHMAAHGRICRGTPRRRTYR